jgi:two-component system cell cycle response regulator DivK
MSKHILVVEDQEDNRQILRDLLGSAGYRMTEAWDGEAGVNAAKEQHPDLILMDIQLPHMDDASHQGRKHSCYRRNFLR